MTLVTYNTIVDMFFWACFVVKLADFVNKSCPAPKGTTP